MSSSDARRHSVAVEKKQVSQEEKMKLLMMAQASMSGSSVPSNEDKQRLLSMAHAQQASLPPEPDNLDDLEAYESSEEELEPINFGEDVYDPRTMAGLAPDESDDDQHQPPSHESSAPPSHGGSVHRQASDKLPPPPPSQSTNSANTATSSEAPLPPPPTSKRQQYDDVVPSPPPRASISNSATSSAQNSKRSSISSIESESGKKKKKRFSLFGSLRSKGGTKDPDSMYTKQKWFHGPLSRPDADSRLQGKPAGTFLIRTSGSVEGYAISLSTDQKTAHVKVRKTDDGLLHTTDQSFENLFDLIDHYKVHGVFHGQTLNDPCKKK